MKKLVLLSAFCLMLSLSAQAQEILHLNRYAADNQALPAAEGYAMMEALLLDTLR